MNELALFAGCGGGILGGRLLGWDCVCAVEYDPFCIEILKRRQDNGFLRPFPIWDDIRTFDGYPWKNNIDIITGGFPCQDISTARGANARGISGEKSGLWQEMARIIREVWPKRILVENSPALTFRGFGKVLWDLASMGYDANWGVFSAADIGASHKRERIWIFAYRDANCMPKKPKLKFYGEIKKSIRNLHRKELPSKARMVGKSDAVPDWMDRARAIGNAQVPAVAAIAYLILSGDERKTIH